MTYLKTVYRYSSVEIEINQKGSSVSMPENMVRIRNMYLSNKSQNITEVTDVGQAMLSGTELVPLGYDLIDY